MKKPLITVRGIRGALTGISFGRTMGEGVV